MSGKTRSVIWPLEAQATQACLLASTLPFAGGQNQDKIETPLQGAASQQLQLQGFQGHLPGRGFYAEAWKELSEQEAAPLQLCKTSTNALLAKRKEIRWCKLITIDHYFTPIELEHSLCVFLSKTIHPFALGGSRKQPHCSQQYKATLLHPNDFTGPVKKTTLEQFPFNRLYQTMACPNTMANSIIMQISTQTCKIRDGAL